MQNYFATHSGKMISVETFSEDDILLDDIAHSLASPKNQRYGGAQSYETSYTVAQHSYLLAQYCLEWGNDLARYALMHDASEAYLCDLVSDIKTYLPDYARIESKFQSIIESKYGIFIPPKSIKFVKDLDKAILIDEAEALFPSELQDLYLNGIDKTKRLGVKIDTQITPYKDKDQFLGWCEFLGIKD